MTTLPLSAALSLTDCEDLATPKGGAEPPNGVPPGKRPEFQQSPDLPAVAGGLPNAAEPQHRPFLRRRGSASDSDPTIEPAVRTCSRKVASRIEPFQAYSIDDTQEPTRRNLRVTNLKVAGAAHIGTYALPERWTRERILPPVMRYRSRIMI